MDVMPNVLDLLQELIRVLKEAPVANLVRRTSVTPDAVDFAKAETNLERIAAGLGCVLPTDRTIGLTEVLSSGQYTALELCLANEHCAQEPERSLGLPG